MAVIEGHAEHVMDAVAPDLLPRCRSCASRWTAGAARNRGSHGMLARLLGLDLKLAVRAAASTSATRSSPSGGTAALHHVFSGPEALPTLASSSDPEAWLRRVGLDGPVPNRPAPEPAL